MKLDWDDEESAILDAFGGSVTSAAAKRVSVHEFGKLIAEFGWFELAAQASLPHSVDLLVGCAEVLGCRSEPIAYPMVETWMAIRVLEAADVDRARDLARNIGEGSLTASLATDLLGGNVVDSLGLVAFQADVDVVVLTVAGPAGLTVHVVPSNELTVRDFNEVDPSMRTGAVAMPNLDAKTLVGTVTPEDAFRLRAELLVMQAAEITGAAQWLFDATQAHLRSRSQFGRALSSFQALQHQLADLGGRIENTRAITTFAAWESTRPERRATRAALLAKGSAGETGAAMSAAAVQLHGALGFTTELGLHAPIRRIMYRTMTGLRGRAAFVEAGRDAMQNPDTFAGDFLPADMQPCHRGNAS